MDDREGMTYASAGVDIDREEEAIESLIAETGDFAGDFAGFVDIGDRYLALATDCVGTKVIVAHAVGDFSSIGIDAIAMNVNDLVAGGFTPTAFVDYLAVPEPDPEVFGEVGEGLAVGAELAGVTLLGGETSVVPEVVRQMDLAGTAVGLAAKDDLLTGQAEPGNTLIGVPSSGIHANGLTLARRAATRKYDYGDLLPGGGGKTIGEALLEPTRIYTELCEPIRDHDVTATAHVTGGGWRNLFRMGENRYVVEGSPDPHPIFDFIQREGNVADREMYRTFNMGTGFVVAVREPDVDTFVRSTPEARIIGRIDAGEPAVLVDDIRLVP